MDLFPRFGRQVLTPDADLMPASQSSVNAPYESIFVVTPWLASFARCLIESYSRLRITGQSNIEY